MASAKSIGARLAVTLMVIVFNLYIGKGHLEWIPNWCLVATFVVAAIYWLSVSDEVKNQFGPSINYLKQKRRVVGTSVIVMALALLLGMGSIGLRQRVLPIFQSAYQAHKSLGNPLGKWQDAGLSASVTKQERATMVWLESDRKWYALPDKGSSVVIRYDEGYTNTNGLEKLEDLRTKFPDVPPNEYPPRRGLADNWLHNPNTWDWMGYAEWDCQFDTLNAKKIFYQEFEHGKIIGPLRVSPPDSNQSPANVAVVLDDGSWEPSNADISSDEVPICNSDSWPTPQVRPVAR